MDTESLLIITGTMGAGKTTVLAEASDILALRRIVHAAIDLDALGVGYLSAKAQNDGVMYSNLQSMRENYAALGVRRFLVARAIEDHAELERCRDAVSTANMNICRLIASMTTMQQRVKMREPGMWQREFVARVEELNAILDRARLEDFVVVNEDRPVIEVAHEMLVRAGWIAD
jgi:adenylylsulfate kinase